MKFMERPEVEKAKDGAKKLGYEILRFKNLKEPILTMKLAQFFRAHVQVIYIAGLVALGCGLFAAVFGSDDFSEFFVNIAVVGATFVIFRMLCELLSACGKGSCDKVEKKEEKKEEVKTESETVSETEKVENAEKTEKVKKNKKR